MLSLEDFIQNINESTKTGMTPKLIRELTKKENYPFKTLVCLSNPNDEHNYEKYNYFIKTVCEVNDMKYVNFESTSVKFDFRKDNYKIYDSKHQLTLHDDDKETTIIFIRKSNKENEDSLKLSDELSKHGFIVTCKHSKSKILGDKYETYKLLNQIDIPQSRTKLIELKDIQKANFDINKFLEDIYPEIKTNNEDDNKKLNYIIKIPNGSCGKGVFMSTGENIFGLIQAIFEIEPKQKLLIQRFEKAKGGDIRVYVVTYNGQQQIIGAIKRIKPKHDFRSNISLGAESQLARLSDEEKQIALDAAKKSGILLCGVDIMHIEKNIDGYDTVVVELNGTPENGKGIDDKLGTNIVNLILGALKQMMKK